jgi:hypothetical protein
MLIKIIVILLLFATLWVLLVLGYKYWMQRSSLARDYPSAGLALALPVGQPPESRGACCLEVPCSDACARRHQEMQDRLAQRYDLVAAEALKVINQSQGAEGS